MLYFQDKKSPLWLAAAGGHKEIVKYFVQQHNCILKDLRLCHVIMTSYFLIPYCRSKVHHIAIIECYIGGAAKSN